MTIAVQLPTEQNVDNAEEPADIVSNNTILLLPTQSVGGEVGEFGIAGGQMRVKEDSFADVARCRSSHVVLCRPMCGLCANSELYAIELRL